MDDNYFMNEAYQEALKVYEKGEAPIGALLVQDNRIISKCGNQTNTKYDPTAHAEILVIRDACRKMKCTKLSNTVLYTTLFPCPMCEAAIIEAGIEKIIYGATTFRWFREVKFVNTMLNVHGPIMEKACRAIFTKRLIDKGRTDILEYENN